ncbi:glycoside hydrolase family 2 protein [Micromonospora sp. DT47]|uniref:glycoside hydrolase family 2 protein n=1 Tax=Micromonospora sp. DT47 TaxID=3393431 RepID=UPI003CEFF3D2
MPDLVRELDGHKPYWPGSPYGGAHANSQSEGDTHNWTVWHGMTNESDLTKLLTQGPTAEEVAYNGFAEDTGRFISEFGIHASPVYETLRRSVPADQLFHHSPSLDHHNKDNPKNKIDLQLVTTTGLPRDLEEFFDSSTIAQAEGLKFGIEHFRRRMPHCSGTLILQFNDCWPTQRWSVEDFYGFQKAGYFYLKRVYAPVLASFKAADDGGVELWITNDTQDPVGDVLHLHHGSVAGESLWQEQIALDVPAATSQPVWRAAPQRLQASPGTYLAVRSPDGLIPANRHFFTAIKDLELPRDTQPAVDIRSADEHTLQVELTAPAYLFFVHLLVADENTRYDDNYFDLIPGETHMVTIRNAARPLTPDMVQVKWRSPLDGAGSAPQAAHSSPNHGVAS